MLGSGMARSRRSFNGESGMTRVTWALAMIVSCALLFVSRGSSDAPSPLSGLASESVSPLVSLISRPLQASEDLGESFADRRRAYEDATALRAEVAALRERQIQYDLLRMKVDRYERILGSKLDTGAPRPKIVARAIGETNGPFVRSLLIDRGRQDGVQNGNPVLSSEGLVGHVINAGRVSSRVLKLDDLNSRIPVMSARSDATAILSGDNTDQPKLAYVNLRRDWAVGDRVVTSGDDGDLPRGLPVGVVVQGEEGELRVALASNTATVDYIWVSPFTPVAPPADADILAPDIPAPNGSAAEAGGTPWPL